MSFFRRMVCSALCLVLCGAAFSISSGIVNSCVPRDNEYVLYIDGYDWGTCSQKVVLRTATAHSTDELKKDDFSALVFVPVTGTSNLPFPIKKGERTISTVFASDENGVALSGSSHFITLEFVISPTEEYANPFNRNVMTADSADPFFRFKITNEPLGIEVSECSGVVCRSASQFKFMKFTMDDLTIKYSFWRSPKPGKKPLIIWFHGIAEGGSIPIVPLLETNAVRLASDEIQQYFENGADVLVPQCPSAWLESTSKDIMGNRLWVPVDLNVGRKIGRAVRPVERAVEKIFGAGVSDGASDEDAIKIPEETPVPTASVSFYTEIVKKIIDMYISRYDYVDKSRIYVGGCSAGGYMTLNMILQNPGFFAAAFPACEAYPDAKLTDYQIYQLTQIPMWFVHSKNDSTIKASTHDESTVRRMKELGGRRVIFTLYDDVRDLTGRWNSSNGRAYEFDDHYSWVYVMNNTPRYEGKSLFEWLSAQSLEQN